MSEGIPGVETLDDKGFDCFLQENDASVVLFYKEDDDKFEQAKNTITEAAQKNNKEGQAYGAVNCKDEVCFCYEQEIFNDFPQFHLYSHGKRVHIFEYDVDAEHMKSAMEKAAKVSKPKGFFKSVCSCVTGQRD